MTAFATAFGIFALLLNLAILGFLVYVWVRIIRRRDIFSRVGWLKGFFALAFLLFITVVFVMALVWGVPTLFE